MKTLPIALSLVSLVVHVFSQTVCDNDEGNLAVKEIVRLGDKLFIMTEDEIYRADGLSIDEQTYIVTTENVIQMSTSIHMEDLRVAFAVNYPNNGTRVVYILEENQNNVEVVTGRILQYDDNGNEVGNAKSIDLSYYNYQPGKEALNLWSLFSKLPQEDLGKNLMAMTNFPLSEDEEENKPSRRMFVYYLETPERDQQSSCPGCFQMQRYIYKAIQRKGHDLLWDLDDTTPNKCENLQGTIVNASVTLNDYEYDYENQNHKFYLMEVRGKQYDIYRINMKDDKVVNIIHLKSNFVGTIFGCKQSRDESLTEPPKPIPITPPTTAETEGQSTGKGNTIHPDGKEPEGEPSPSTSSSWWIWVILLFLLMIIIIAGVAIFYFIKQNTPKDDNNAQPAIVPQRTAGPGENSAGTSKRGADLEAPLPPPQEPYFQVAPHQIPPSAPDQLTPQVPLSTSDQPLPEPPSQASDLKPPSEESIETPSSPDSEEAVTEAP